MVTLSEDLRTPARLPQITCTILWLGRKITPALYTLRKYMSYTAGNTGAVLDYRELLKGPAILKKGQQLFVRIYYAGSALGGDLSNQYYYRQAPAFWFNGTVPK